MAKRPEDERDEEELSLSEQPTLDSGAMETLAERTGRRVDPGIELDPVDLSDAETIASEDAPPRSSESDPGAAPTPRYTVHGEIARGGMGAIYRVRDKDLRRSLAMKVILGGDGSHRAPGEPVSPEDLHRFLEEAQVTAQLAHPGVVPVHELGIDHRGRVYFTMSLVRGETLSRVIEQARAGTDGWSTTRALQVILRVCETMAFAHDKGVIHRDIKPANVMVGRFGVTYVMDWGLAKVLGREDTHDIRLRNLEPASISRVETKRTDSESTEHDSPIMTMDGAVLGTPAYMPPEQAEGRVEQVDKRSDVYAIGTLLYQLLTGEAPYVKSGARMSPHAVLAAVSMGPPRPVHEVDKRAPEELQAICDKAMSRDRAARYATAEELADDLQRSLDGRVVRAHRTGAVIEMKKWVQRNRGIAATAAAAVLALTVVVAYSVDALSDEAARAKKAEDSATLRADEAERERERADDRAAEAERERDAKLREAKRARSYALTQVSAGVEASDPMLALLLAREAARTLAAPHTATRLRAALLASADRGKFGLSQDPIVSVHYSPSRSHILVLDKARNTLLFERRRASARRLGGPAARANSARFSPDGTSVLTAEPTGARLFDLDGRELVHFRSPSGYGFSGAASVSTGDRVFTTSADKRDRAARLWSSDGTLIAEFDTGRDRRVALAPTGEHVMTGYGRTILLWDSGGTVLAEFSASGLDTTPREWKTKSGGTRRDQFRGMSFSPSGRQILSVFQTSAYLLDIEGRRIAEFGPRIEEDGGVIVRRVALPAGYGASLGDWTDEPTGPAEAPTNLWTVEGDVLEVLGDWSRPLRLESPDGQVVREPTPASSSARESQRSDTSRVFGALPRGADRDLSTVTFPRGGRWALTGHTDGSVHEWRLDACEVGALRHAAEPLVAEFVAGAEQIVTVARNGVCRLWSLDGTPIRVLAEDGVTDAAVSPDGTRIALGTNQGGARIIDLRGNVLASLGEHEGRVRSIVFSPDGERVLTISHGGQGRLWGVRGEELHRLANVRASGAFSADGERIVTAGGAMSVFGADGERVGTLSPFGDEDYGPQLSPGGRFTLAPVSGAVAGVHSADGALRAALAGHTEEVRCALFSPTHAHVLTGSADRTARLWDLDGAELAVLRGHQGRVTTGAFAPDGELIATGADNGIVRLWDADGNELATLSAHEAPIGAIRFSPDGRHLLTQSDEQVVRVWLAHQSDVLALANERVTRDFTERERELHGNLLGELAGDMTVVSDVTAKLDRASWPTAEVAQKKLSPFRLVGERQSFVVNGAEVLVDDRTGAALPVGASIDSLGDSLALGMPGGAIMRIPLGSRITIAGTRTVLVRMTQRVEPAEKRSDPNVWELGAASPDRPAAGPGSTSVKESTARVVDLGGGRILFEADSASVVVARATDSVQLRAGQGIELYAGRSSGANQGDLAFRTKATNADSITVVRQSAEGTVHVVIPPATRGVLEILEAGKLRVSNDVTSRRTAKVAIRTEFAKHRDQAELGPGTYATIDLRTGPAGLGESVESGDLSPEQLPWPTTAASRVSTARKVRTAALAGDEKQLLALFPSPELVRKILAAEASHKGRLPPTADESTGEYEKLRETAFRALLERPETAEPSENADFVDQGVGGIHDSIQIWLARAVSDAGIVRFRVWDNERSLELFVFRHDDDWYILVR